jgi:hypothetical protein
MGIALFLHSVGNETEDSDMSRRAAARKSGGVRWNRGIAAPDATD